MMTGRERIERDPNGPADAHGRLRLDRRRTITIAALTAALLMIVGGCHLSFGDLDPSEDPIHGTPEEAVDFLVIGDWGRGGFFRQDDVARQMAQTADEIGAEFVISTGDNFYEKGVTSVDDPKWDRSYESVYSAPSLQIPWYVALGNHDYLGDVPAQIAYSEISDRWTMPARYYAVEVELDDTTTAVFAFLDTVPLVDEATAGAPAPDISESETDARWAVQQQLAWLDSTLAASHADWRFVVGHHPLYSADGRHRDYPILRESVGPILDRREVDVYLAGHVHALQHLAPDETPVHHVISGAGSLVSKINRDIPVEFAAGAPGFAAMSLTPDSLLLTFVGHKGTVGYSTVIPPRPES